MIGRTNSFGGSIDRQVINYQMLYDAGDECVDVTGGLIGEGVLKSNNSLVEYTGGITKNTVSILIDDTYGNSTYSNFGVHTKNLIPLSGYSKFGAVLDITVENSGSGIRTAGINGYTSTSPINATVPTAGYLTNDGNFSRAVLLTDITSSVDSYLRVFTAYGTSILYHMFLVKEDDWQTWLIKGGLTVSDYASLDAVMVDTTALATLMNNEEAVKYMLLNCTGTVMASVIQSETALKVLRACQYRNDIFKNKHWAKFLKMVGEVDSAADFEYGYTRLDYIQSSGTQYIDTGVDLSNHNTSYEIDLDFMYLNDESVHAYFFGTQEATSPFKYAFFRTYSSETQWSLWGYNGSQPLSMNRNTRYRTKSKNDGITVSLSIDDSVILSSESETSVVTSYPLFLSARNLAGTAESFSSMRIYSSKILIDDIIIRNFVPCYRKSDYVAGLYDMVNGVFYTNQGTGDFITEPKGNAVFLYKDGDECTDVSGGLSGVKTTFSSYTATIPTITKNDTNISASLQGGSSGSCGSLSTENAIDLSRYSKINILFSASSGNTAFSQLMILSDRTKQESSIAGCYLANTSESYEDKIITLDISAINQSAYVAIFMLSFGTVASITVKRIWLE